MKNSVAKIDNQLVLKAHYSLSASEQKLILFLISKINPKARKDFGIQSVKIKDIQNIFVEEGKKWGSIYSRVDLMCSSIMDKKITLPKGFIFDGKIIRMNRYIQWFSDIEPFLDEDDEISIKFQFSPSLKDFLLQLHRYVKVNLIEVMPLRGKYTIRMYQIFKAERDRTKQFKGFSTIAYELEELKAMLEIGTKYKVLKDFRRNVLDPMTNEINTHSQEITIKYVYLKTRRRVTGIEFHIFDKKEEQLVFPSRKSFEDYVPTEEEIDQLSRSNLHAYEMLIDFGIKAGIAYKRVIPKVTGGVVNGYEDIFIQYALQHFREWAKQQQNKDESAATFVNWWTKKQVFSHDQDVFWKINEKVNQFIKSQDEQSKDNRDAAKGIPNSQFVEAYRKQSQQE